MVNYRRVVGCCDNVASRIMVSLKIPVNKERANFKNAFQKA